MEHPNMRKIVARTIDGAAREYVVPSIGQSVARSERTLGEQYDRVERKVVQGGLPLVWARVQ